MADLMADSIVNPALPTHPERLRMRPEMAKATLEPPNKVRKFEEWQREAGICRRANALSQLTDKEIAAALEMTPAQFSEQMAARERPQGERYRACDRMRGFYLIAQAEAYPELFDVVTTITVRRIA